jgi:molybdopterin synthase catalytic subunit
VLEDPRRAGPLAALASGARALERLGHAGPVLVVACDLPLLTRSALEMLAAWPGIGTVVPIVDGRAQPLCARWSAHDLEAAAGLVAAGERSMAALLARPGITLLPPDRWGDEVDPRCFTDVDDASDLERLGLAWMSPAPLGGDDWIAVTAEQIPFGEIMAWVSRPSCGALVAFCGTVRDHSDGRPGVVALEYEAYEEQVEPRLGAVAAAARRRWPAVGRLALVHRIGRLEVGEVSVVVAASTPHRHDAFEAARFCIDTLKETVPIWKRETWAGGSDWGLCPHDVVDMGVSAP